MMRNSSGLTRVRLMAAIASAGLLAAACNSGGPTAAASSSATPVSQPSPTAAQPSSGGSAATVQLPPPEKTSITVGVSAATEPIQFAETLANVLGYYKEVGFTNVQVVSFEGDGKAVQSLVAGALDAATIGSSSAINSVLTDTPIKIVAMNGVRTTDEFVCTKDIKTAADVKGKIVAISTFGSTAHGSALLSLKALGLTSSDVTLTQVGNETARIAAMKGGSVGCSVVDVSEKPQLIALGFNILYDQMSSYIYWGRSGLAITADFASKYPNTVLDMVAATLKAQNYMYTNPSDTAQQFATSTQQQPSVTTGLIQAFLQYGDQGMGWTDAAFTNPRDTLAIVTPQVASVDVTKAYDKSYLQKLYDEGYYTQIQDPAKPF